MQYGPEFHTPITHRASGVRVRLLKFLAAYLGHFPDGTPVLRHAWLAEAQTGSSFQPQFRHEVTDVRFVSHTEFQALYDAGLVRMHHTRLFYEDARRETGHT